MCCEIMFWVGGMLLRFVPRPGERWLLSVRRRVIIVPEKSYPSPPSPPHFVFFPPKPSFLSVWSEPSPRQGDDDAAQAAALTCQVAFKAPMRVPIPKPDAPAVATLPTHESDISALSYCGHNTKFRASFWQGRGDLKVPCSTPASVRGRGWRGARCYPDNL